MKASIGQSWWPMVHWRGMVATVVFGLIGSEVSAVSSDVSDVAAIHKLTLSAGPNFLSAPLHRTQAFRGAVDSVTAGTVTFDGSPGWSANQFGSRDGFSQYIAILRKDASSTPGNEGDWWPVTGNTANTLTLNTGGDNLTTLLANGDEMDIRRLTSIKDLFGTGASLRLNKDKDGSANPGDEDVIYLVSGTSFSSEIFYHDGSLAPAGYYVDGTGPFDGSTISIGPDEPIMVFRKTGAPTMNILFTGQVQSTRLTHYLAPGPNPISTAFPIDSAVGSSGLQESGWKADADGSANAADEDLLYTVVGSSFSDEVFLHDGSLVPQGWYVNGVADDAFGLGSGQGFVVFVQSPGGLRWRETVPF